MENPATTTEPVTDSTATDNATVTTTSTPEHPQAKRVTEKPAAKKPTAKSAGKKATKATKAETSDTHIVKHGEDILSIATEHSIAVSTLKALNGVRVGSGGVSIGQEIKLR